jgi:hypothetical protein
MKIVRSSAVLWTLAFWSVAVPMVQSAQAAPTSTPAPAPAAPTPSAQQQRSLEVTDALKRFLNRRISSPSGKLTMVIRPGARADLGYFNEVVIVGKPTKIKKLQVSEFSMHARNVRLNPATLTRKRDKSIDTLAATTSMRAVITENDLTSMLARGRASKDMNLRIKFLNGAIRVTGNWNWGWFSGPVIAVGKLRLVKGTNGNQVYFDISSLKLNGTEVPAFIKSRFSDKLNPLISYDDLPFSPKIRTLTFEGPKAIITT